MGFKAVSAASVLAAGLLSVGIAAPAYGTDQISQHAIGTYEAAYPWGKKTWVVTACGNDSPQCVHVTEYAVDDTERKSPLWSGDAHWNVGWWIMRGVNVPDTIYCEDGAAHALPTDFAWDAASDSGVRSYHEPGICYGEAYNGSDDFTLTRIGSAEN